MEGSECVRRFRRGAKINRRADAIAQFQVSGDKIGVKVRQEDVLDLKRVLGGERKVLVRIALRIDDRRRACPPIPDKVGGVGQTRQIKLLENHGGLSSLAAHYFGWGTIRK